MEVRFWGVRGSIAKAGPQTIRYGGNTSCVEVRSANGTLVVLDCGTGAHGLGMNLIGQSPQPVRGHLLISHTHWDHIQGVPFFAPLFVPGNEWDIYAPSGLGTSLRETLAGQMQYTYFPITIEELGATIRYHDLLEGTLQIDDITVRTHYLNHPALTLGYRLETDECTVVYACDHEPHARPLASGDGEPAGEDLHYQEFLQGADLVIHDAQYTAAEYSNKVGWGHSTWEYAVMMCKQAGVRQLALTHHDPNRDDDQVDEIAAAAQERAGGSLKVFGASEGPIHNIAAPLARSTQPEPEAPSAYARSAALEEHVVLTGLVDDRSINLVGEVTAADGIQLTPCEDGSQLLGLTKEVHPSLLILEDHPRIGARETAASVRSVGEDWSKSLPIMTVSDHVGPADAEASGITDWLTRPFSPEYARTRIRAWIMRRKPRWLRGEAPADEEARIEALHSLNILDTPREERFDRITRLVTQCFEVPVAFINLIDRERQWSKACFGFETTEGSRDSAFCSHTILQPDVLIVPDALLDDRFAENPLVTGGPRIRFYAGCPINLRDGSAIGALCCASTRPRDFSPDEVAALKDFANLVVRELQIGAAQ